MFHLLILADKKILTTFGREDFLLTLLDVLGADEDEHTREVDRNGHDAANLLHAGEDGASVIGILRVERVGLENIPTNEAV